MVKKYSNVRRSNVKRINSRKREKKSMEVKCPYCQGIMKCRGPGDAAGAIFYKCRNKRCGRTLWERAGPPKKVIPVVYQKKV